MLASIFSLNVLQTALELGCIYALVALALFLSYSILNIADLSTDGCFTLGCAVACQVALTGHPILALFAAMAAGVSQISFGVSLLTFAKTWLSVITILGLLPRVFSVLESSFSLMTMAAAPASSTSRMVCCCGRIRRPFGAAFINRYYKNRKV